MKLLAIPLTPTHFLHIRFTADTRRQVGFSFLQRVNWQQQKGTVLGQYSDSLVIWSDSDRLVLVAKDKLAGLKPLQDYEYTLKLTEIIKQLLNEDIVSLAKNMADLERFEEKIPLLYQEGNLALIVLAEASWNDWLAVAPLVVEFLAQQFKEYVHRQEQQAFEAVGPSLNKEVEQTAAIMQFTFNTLLELKPDYTDKAVMASYYAMATQLAHYFYTQALNHPEKIGEQATACSENMDRIPNSVAALVCAMMGGANQDSFIHHACHLLWIKALFPDVLPGLMPHQFNLDEWYRQNPDKLIVLYHRLMADPYFIACNDLLQKNRQPAAQFAIAKLRYFYVNALFKTSYDSLPQRQDALTPLLQLVRNNRPEAVQFLLNELSGPSFNGSSPCFFLDGHVALALSHHYGRSLDYGDNQLAWSFWQKGKTTSMNGRSSDHSHVKAKLEVLFESGNAQGFAIQRLKAEAEVGHPVALQYLRETSHHVPAAALACLELFAQKKTLTSMQYAESGTFYTMARRENAALAARCYCVILKHQHKLTLKTLLAWIEEGHEFAIEELELKIKGYLRKDKADSIEKKILPLLERPQILKALLPEMVILLIHYMDKVWRYDFEDDEPAGNHSPVFCNEWLLAFLHRLKRMQLSNKKQLIPLLLMHTAALLTEEGNFLLFQLAAQEYSFTELAAATWLKTLADILVTCTQGHKTNPFKLRIEEFLLNNPHVVKALAVCEDARKRLHNNPYFTLAVNTLEGHSEVSFCGEGLTPSRALP